ncbi:DMT family transporter [Arcanobacterium canis]|uniref:SMR family transporter n=1 Tax=Arcanobacterium canis TaxID=999183 RepID=A0ABY8FXU8_9ACTO|nr:SMR family transporter [Arcanobacterium canis]WFM83172.1 SMR family transporter [Arcanobacterium canis]
MYWFVLIISGLLEAVWATALGKSAAFTKIVPSITFVIALIFSMLGLAFAMRDLPTGTAYAVWVGIGVTVTVVYAMLTGTEPASVLKIVFLLMIVSGIIGLKVVS